MDAWDRQAREPTRWHERFQKFLLAGVTRSIYATYLAEHDERLQARQAKRPVVERTTNARPGLPKQWREQAQKWNWRERADAWDDVQRQRRTELYEARRDEILSSGFAAQFVRIAELVRVAELLQAEVWTEDKRWVPDVKQIGSGDDAQRVDIVRFNPAVIQQFRETLADIAAETGDRAQRVKLDGTMRHVEVTSDDMAAARAKAQQWESEKFGNE